MEHVEQRPGASVPEWRLEGPVASHGRGDGPGALYDVRGVRRLPDGRIAVANGGSAEVLIVDPSSGDVTKVGSGGAGPGSFMVLEEVAPWSGDSLITFDTRLRRLTAFHLDGSVGRTATMARDALPGVGPLSPAGWLDSGHLVLETSTLDAYEIERSDGLRVTRDHGYVLFVSREGTVIESIAKWAGDARAFRVSEPSSGNLRIRSEPVPFLPRLEVSVFGDRVAVGATRAYEFNVFDSGRRLQMVLRVPRTPVLVDDAIRQRWIGDRLAGVEDPALRRERRVALENLPLPDTLPYFDSIRLDSEGYLWVSESRVTTTGRASEWVVYDPLGHTAGVATLPPEFTVFEIGPDYVLGISEDELGVEILEEYALIRGAG